MDKLHFTKTHEWLKQIDEENYILGITDHAQELLGDMVYIELPVVGDIFSAGDEFCVVESVKAASGVYAPCDLEVTGLNSALESEPELVNSSCYDDGWLVKFKCKKIDGLLNADQYQQLVESE